MLISLAFVLVAAIAASGENDPATDQLVDYSKTSTGSIEVLTTASGAPVRSRDLNTLNSNLLINEYFMEGLQSLVRERIPERSVHALGNGAFGFFEVTHDITHICKAKLFSEIGKKTPIAVRFSISGPKSGTPDTAKASRGIAVKFYAEEGNFDLTGFNIPIFPFKNPSLGIPLSHILKPNPSTNLPDLNMIWDFAVQSPEAIFTNLYLFSDLGLQATYRHMPWYTVHTFQVCNENGTNSFVRFHFVPVAGVKNLNATEAAEIAAGDPNHYARDLYNAIAKCDYPSWDVKMQILSEDDRQNADMDIFDITKYLPLDKYKLHPVGRFTLNENPLNHFAQIEQLAVCPGNLVPGIVGCPDKIFETRRFLYKDAQNYRLGSNYRRIPVNCPINSKVVTYLRDGVPPNDDNGRNRPNYSPNSFDNIVTIEDNNEPPLIQIYEEPANNFDQAGEFYSQVLTSEQQTSLIESMLPTLCPCADVVKELAVKYFTIIHSDLGERIADGLLTSCTN